LKPIIKTEYAGKPKDHIQSKTEPETADGKVLKSGKKRIWYVIG